jgi:hypothetical protein
MRGAIPLSILTLAAACGGAQYGYAREYEPLSEEEDLLEAATQVNYEDVRRDPADYRSTTLSWFGVVTNVAPEESGAGALVALTFRTHQPRHLCGDETASSCRVTVSDRAGGPFSIHLEIRPEDREGVDRLWSGSLIRVYGSPNGEFDSEGGPIIEAQWYRHWPRGKYVTTGAAGSMRR